MTVLPAREDEKCGLVVFGCVLAIMVDFGTFDSETQALAGGQACEPILVTRVTFQELAWPLFRGGAVGQCIDEDPKKPCSAGHI